MTAGKRSNGLYHAALEDVPDACDVGLDEACAGDGDLRREVAELLASFLSPWHNCVSPSLQNASAKRGLSAIA